MANQEHLDILKQGVEVWNQWRKEHPDITPELSEANLNEADLSYANLGEANLTNANLTNADFGDANFSKANLSGAYLEITRLDRAYLGEANLSGAYLDRAILSEANLSGAYLDRAYLSYTNLSRAILSRAILTNANLSNADLSKADLTGADLTGADLSGADLNRANLTGADLSDATLNRTLLVGTNLREATLTQCSIYGISAWTVELEGAIQNNLIITPKDEPTITLDNLKVAQFIYLLLNNREIRDVIDTIARKAVLILGRFTPDRKVVLDTLREALRTHGYLPILFDFDKPSSRNLTETVRTLAHLSRFIIADLTDPSSIPHELQAIIPTLAVPVQPVLLEGKRAYAMFVDLLKTYHWVLPIHYYRDQTDLLAMLKEQIIEPAELKAQELAQR